jgi:hypothetical protein
MSSTDTNKTYPRVLGIETPKQCVATSCGRCGGAGGSSHWPGWTCFRCGGNGSDPTHRQLGFPPAWTDEQCQTWTDERDARLSANRARTQAKRQAKADANTERMLTQYRILRMLDEVRTASTYEPRADEFDDYVIAQRHESGLHWSELAGYMTDIYWRACRDGAITDKQATALLKGWDVEVSRRQTTLTREQERAAAQPVPTGRQTIEGRVLSLKWTTNSYNGHTVSTQKATILGESGWRVYVSVPGKSTWEIDNRVRLTCDITQSDDDPAFGFGKRPTKAEVL